MSEPTPETPDLLKQIVRAQGGSLLAYTCVQSGQYDDCYAMAYSLPGGSWYVAVGDSASDALLHSEKQAAPMRKADIEAAITAAAERVRIDPPV